MLPFSPVPGRSFPQRNRKVFGPPYRGQQFSQMYDNRNSSFMSPNNSSSGILGNLPNHINTLAGHASTIKNGYNLMRQLGSVMRLFR